jgi:ABC-type nitrate/sulfonate/bicarbonate transport system substrate-binding protein
MPIPRAIRLAAPLAVLPLLAGLVYLRDPAPFICLFSAERCGELERQRAAAAEQARQAREDAERHPPMPRRADWDELQHTPVDPKPGQTFQLGAGGPPEGPRLTRALRVVVPRSVAAAPGLVANRGLATHAASIYSRRHRLEVTFQIVDDPDERYHAFLDGKADVMVDDLPDWTRRLPEFQRSGGDSRIIALVDWSRGADALVAGPSVTAVESLAGRRVATTRHDRSEWLLLYLLGQSKLTVAQQRGIYDSLVGTPSPAAALQALRDGRADAAVLTEPELSRALASAGGLHLVADSTVSRHLIADVMVAHYGLLRQSSGSAEALLDGWFDGIDELRRDPVPSLAVVGTALGLEPRTAARALAGLRLADDGDQMNFFLGKTGHKDFARMLVELVAKIWDEMRVLPGPVNPLGAYGVRQATLVHGRRAENVHEEVPANPPLLGQAVPLFFAPGADHPQPGSHLFLDTIGETLASARDTVLLVEPHSTADAALAQRRADGVVAYLMNEFTLGADRFRQPDHPLAPALPSGAGPRDDLYVQLAAAEASAAPAPPQK